MAKPLQVIVVGITLSTDDVLVLIPIYIQTTRAFPPLCLSISALFCIKVTAYPSSSLPRVHSITTKCHLYRSEARWEDFLRPSY